MTFILAWSLLSYSFAKPRSTSVVMRWLLRTSDARRNIPSRN